MWPLQAFPLSINAQGWSLLNHLQVVKLLSSTMILMADHEITNSASVLLGTASTLADPYSCCAAATLSGVGILHGGAIEVAYKQLEAVRDLREVPLLIEAVKAGKMRLFGYGHRKWKVSCPTGPSAPVIL